MPLESLVALLDDFGECHPNDGRPLSVSGGRITVDARSPEGQEVAIRILRAATGTMVVLVLQVDLRVRLRHGFEPSTLAESVPEDVRELWRRNQWPEPRSVADALGAPVGIMALAAGAAVSHLAVGEDDVHAGRTGISALGPPAPCRCRRSAHGAMASAPDPARAVVA